MPLGVGGWEASAARGSRWDRERGPLPIRLGIRSQRLPKRIPKRIVSRELSIQKARFRLQICATKSTSRHRQVTAACPHVHTARRPIVGEQRSPWGPAPGPQRRCRRRPCVASVADDVRHLSVARSSPRTHWIPKRTRARLTVRSSKLRQH